MSTPRAWRKPLERGCAKTPQNLFYGDYIFVFISLFNFFLIVLDSLVRNVRLASNVRSTGLDRGSRGSASSSRS